MFLFLLDGPDENKEAQLEFGLSNKVLRFGEGEEIMDHVEKSKFWGAYLTWAYKTNFIFGMKIPYLYMVLEMFLSDMQKKLSEKMKYRGFT